MLPTQKQISFAKALGLNLNFSAMSRQEVSRAIELAKIKHEKDGTMPKRESKPRRVKGDGYEQWGEDAAWMRYAERDRDY